MLLLFALPAQAQFQGVRKLPEPDARAAVEALLAHSTTPLAEDPSCKSDLNQPGGMTVAQGLARMLTNAANQARPQFLQVNCFKRPGYPLAAGQEFCRLGFTERRQLAAIGQGLLFVMDWGGKVIVPGSVECY